MIKILFKILLILFGFHFMRAQSYRIANYRGNIAFKMKNYSSAKLHFLERIHLKNDFSGHYNLANTFFRENAYPEASAEYKKAIDLAKIKEDKSFAYYNWANFDFNLGKIEKAIEKYQEAIKLNPYNEIIRKNYNIAKLKQKEFLSNREKKQQAGQSEKKEEQSGEQKQNQNQGQAQKNKGEGQSQEGQSSPKGATVPKDVENKVMNQLDGRERETAQRIMNQRVKINPNNNEKDW